jgi:hypothetical protein
LASAAKRRTTVRAQGRPTHGRASFGQSAIDRIQDGSVSDIARALRISVTTVQQWERHPKFPLPVQRLDHGHTLVLKADLVAFLERTGRFKIKPEYRQEP